jgi:deazaflavin-dependent oxidoreductase (nitroreductase family)
VASSRPGAWFFARVLHYLDAGFFKLSRGRRTLSGILSGLPTVILTTTGARSGQSRSTPLLCIRDGQNPSAFALIASNWGQRHYPNWYFNLKAHPQAVCTVDGKTASYMAREATGDEYERFWQRATEIYMGYALYKQRIASGRRIPIMVMTPAA